MRERNLALRNKIKEIKYDYENSSSKLIKCKFTFEEYKEEIKNFLIKDAWKYSEEFAQEIVDKNIDNIKEAYEENRDIDDIALDIGYCCG